MGVRAFISLAAFFLAVLTMAHSDQRLKRTSHASGQEASIKTTQQNTFQTSPALPDCYTYAVDRGDPKTGPSVTLSKLAAGCKVPWHTHSANAQVLFVSGHFQLEMQGQKVVTLTQGSYAYVPANHLHQESCLDGCTYYVIREGAADVHYVDASGKEISPEVALAAVDEHPAKATSARQ